MPDTQAPRLVVSEEQLVINPDPDNVSGGGVPDQRTAEMMR